MIYELLAPGRFEATAGCFLVGLVCGFLAAEEIVKEEAFKEERKPLGDGMAHDGPPRTPRWVRRALDGIQTLSSRGLHSNTAEPWNEKAPTPLLPLLLHGRLPPHEGSLILAKP